MGPAPADEAGHVGAVLVVGAGRVAAVVAGVVPDIAGAHPHAIVMEVDVGREARGAGIIPCALPARRQTYLADILQRVVGGRTGGEA